MMEFNESPLFLVMDPSMQSGNEKKKLPVYLYESELHVMNGVPKMLFVQIAFKIETSETEGIAIDHISKVTPTSDSNRSSGRSPYLCHLLLSTSCVSSSSFGQCS